MYLSRPSRAVDYNEEQPSTPAHHLLTIGEASFLITGPLLLLLGEDEFLRPDAVDTTHVGVTGISVF